MSRTFSEECLARLRELESEPFEEKFRAAWERIAKNLGTPDRLPETESGRTVWRMCLSQALAESLDPDFYAKGQLKRNHATPTREHT